MLYCVMAFLLLALIIHDLYFSWSVKRAISAVHPNHPELRTFPIGGPLGMLLRLIHFRSMTVIDELPAADRGRILVHYRIQIALLLVFVAPLVALVLFAQAA